MVAPTAANPTANAACALKGVSVRDRGSIGERLSGDACLARRYVALAFHVVGRTLDSMRLAGLLPLLAGSTLLACAPPQSVPPSSGAAASPQPMVVTPISAVTWEPLNPARGDASPRAANLWGDRTQPGASGFLVRFVDGFASPPHIHNVSYRAVVLEGLIHNDDPEAAALWMGPGSFWTQPKGESHITAAKGSASVLAYVEIDDGPYLVRPAADAVEGPERALNVDATNLVWVEHDGTHVAYLWGQPGTSEPYGLFVRVPKGTRASLGGVAGPTHAVVVAGSVVDPEPLAVGSKLSASGPASVGCAAHEDCVFYVRTQGTLSASEASP